MTNTPQPIRGPIKMSAAILQCDAIPQFGAAPSFPWEAFEQQISKHLGLEGLTLSCGTAEWKDTSQLYADLGSPLEEYVARLNSFSGDLLFLMPTDAWEAAVGWILTKENHAFGSSDTEVRKGLQRMLGVELCHCFQALGFIEDATPMLVGEGKQEADSYLCMDIRAQFQGSEVLVRAALPDSFVQEWRKRYAERRPSEISDDMAANLSMTVHLEAGAVALSQEQWDALKPGDCFLADQLFLQLDPESGAASGHAVMKVNGLAVAQVRVRRSGKVEITQTA